jgi:hypothetical protein
MKISNLEKFNLELISNLVGVVLGCGAMIIGDAIKYRGYYAIGDTMP